MVEVDLGGGENEEQDAQERLDAVLGGSWQG